MAIRQGSSRNFEAFGLRVDWDRHVALLEHRREFANTYLMKRETFDHMVDVLRDDILRCDQVREFDT